MTSPPSYESVMAEIKSKVPANPSVGDAKAVLAAINSLTPAQANVMAQNTDKAALQFTDAQKASFALGASQAATDKKNEDVLWISAQQAADACTAVNNVFLNLTKELATIDGKNMPPAEGAFGPRFAALYTRYRAIVASSQVLAVKIATYGQRFDKVMCPMCCDPKITTEKRLEKIREFIKDAQTFQGDALNMQNSFDSLKVDFNSFVATFKNWATGKEKEDSEELARLQGEMSTLQGQLGKLQGALLGMGIALGATLPATGIAACLSGPFAPLVIIGGLILAAVELGVVIGLYYAVDAKKTEIGIKQKRIDEVTKEIQDIKDARKNLTDLGDKELLVFNSNMATLSGVWQHARNDATKVEEWLLSGAKDADMPEYMQKSCKEACQVYETMAKYLNAYADGVKAAKINPDN